MNAFSAATIAPAYFLPSRSFACAHFLFCAMTAGICSLGNADEQSPCPAVPSDRRAMLESLEKLKSRSPRLPMSAEQISKIQASSQEPIVNNSMLRRIYLPQTLQGSRIRQPDPAMTLPNDFGVELFWIASRANDCHYCLGHQEGKLLALGVLEPTLAALDCDWSLFPPEKQLAFAFSKTLTQSPYMLSEAHLDALRLHFEEMEILEIIFLVSRYNATNRWTDATGIPQESFRTFASSLTADELSKPSIVAPLSAVARPVPPSRLLWKQSIAQRATRSSRFPCAGDPSLSNHVRLLLNFPVAGQQIVNQLQSLETESRLSAIVRWAIFWTASRHDQAWYMQHESYRNLCALGLTDEHIFSLEQKETCPEELWPVLLFATKLTVSPQSIDDRDLEQLLEKKTAAETAEIIFTVGMAAFLDRFTEASGLGWSTAASDTSR